MRCLAASDSSVDCIEVWEVPEAEVLKVVAQVSRELLVGAGCCRLLLGAAGCCWLLLAVVGC